MAILANMTTIGDFSFIHNVSDRMMLEDMYDAVSKVEAWNELRDGPGKEGCMWGEQDLTGWIAINLKDRVGHSVASFALSLRTMQFIAKHGWNAFVESYNK